MDRYLETAPVPVPRPGGEVVTLPLEAHGSTDGTLRLVRDVDDRARAQRDAMTGELARLGAHGWTPDPAAALDLIEGPSWPSYTDAAPALTHPDDAHLRLREQRAHLVELTMKELTRRHPEMAADDADQRSRTLEDLEHILDFLATALYLDDVALFAEFLGWLGEVLGARGVPPSALELGLEALDAAIPAALPRAHAFVRQGTRLLRV